jgi:molecular chaperone HscB
MGAIPASAAEQGGAKWPATEQLKCWQCGTDRAPGLFCPACDAIQPFPEQADYFEVMDLPGRRLVIDTEALRRRYYELHRQLHPDLYQTGPQEARVASLRNTATVNRAYATLRDPVDRGLYWLTLRGESVGANNNRVPPHLAELVFEVHEKLEELRAAQRGNGAAGLAQEVGAARAQLLERQAALHAQLQQNFARWDAQAADADTLTRELKGILSALAYVRTLIRDVEKELEN